MSHLITAYLPADGLLCLDHDAKHDACIALWWQDRDSLELLRYWELERVSGQKHHQMGLASRAAAEELARRLLADEGLDLDAIETIWGWPALERGRPIENVWDGTGLPVHSLVHLYTALLADGSATFASETIFAMALDAAPDWDMQRPVEWYFAGALSRAGRVDLFPVESPGPLYLAARLLFGREEGTLMALASATTCAVPVDVGHLAAEGLHWGPGSAALVEPALRDVVAAVERALAGPGGAARLDERFTMEENVQSAAMKLVDDAARRIVRRNVDRAVAAKGLDPAAALVAVGGGFGLNCPTNSWLVDEVGFRRFLGPPCMNDGGQALGLGLLAAFATEARRPSFHFRSPCLGRRQLRLDEALERFGASVTSTGPAELGAVVRDLERGPVAWVSGAAEIGPRALGHRSLLADPRDLAAKDRLNQMKDRQWWRPVAPIVLEEEGDRWFERFRASPYMLETFVVREDVRHLVPAIVHLDGSARVQSIDVATDPELHALLVAFFRATGVPMLCNTSLNHHGEPIVDDAVQAIRFCINKGVPVAVIGGVRVEVHAGGERSGCAQPMSDRLAADIFEDTTVEVLAAWDELGLTPREYRAYCDLARTGTTLDVSSAADRQELRRLAELRRRSPQLATGPR